MIKETHVARPRPGWLRNGSGWSRMGTEPMSKFPKSTCRNFSLEFRSKPVSTPWKLANSSSAISFLRFQDNECVTTESSLKFGIKYSKMVRLLLRLEGQGWCVLDKFHSF